MTHDLCVMENPVIYTETYISVVPDTTMTPSATRASKDFAFTYPPQIFGDDKQFNFAKINMF